MQGRGSNNRLTSFVFQFISTLMLSMFATMAAIYGAGRLLRRNMVNGLSYTWTTRWMVITMLMVLGESQSKWGINYGLLGDNLPPPKDTVNLILSKPTIKMVRIFEPNIEILDALQYNSLGISVGVSHTDLAPIASNPQAAHDWVEKYIIPYRSDIAYITVGNEAIPGPYAQYILPAIKNIQKVINDAGYGDFIQVTTVVSGAVLGTSYPPSAGAFSEETFGIMSDIVKYLYTNDLRTTLMINVYPYFAFASNPQDISLDYALFRSTSPVVMDGTLAYYNLYEAMVDAFLSAMEKVLPEGMNFDVTISETGWPSAGAEYATVENAAAYNNNLKKHLQEAPGTPKRPGLALDVFIFALYNENQKPAGVEQHFGSFYPDMNPVYELW